MTLVDWWRVVNGISGLIAALLLTRAMWRARHRLEPRYVLLGFALCHCMGIMFIAGIGNVFFDQPLLGISMASTAIVWVLFALHPRFDTDPDRRRR